jgi:ubiquinone biosynthesis protein
VIEIVGLVFSIVAAAAVAYVGRRVLGVPVGWPRSILVGLTVLAALNVVLPWMADRLELRIDPADVSTGLAALLVFLLVVGWLFFLGIAFLVALELIIPTGSIPTPWQLVAQIRARNRRTKRYLRVLTIAARHDLGGFVRRSNRRTTPSLSTPAPALARSVRGALNDGGVTIIKIGQLLSTRPDLIGPSFAHELARLQTSTSPVPWDQLEPLVVAAVGGATEEVFTEIDQEPLATASVGPGAHRSAPGVGPWAFGSSPTASPPR